MYEKIIGLLCVFVMLIQMVLPAMPALAAYTYETELEFPVYGQQESNEEPFATLTGDGVQISFKKIQASDGKYYV